jgi:hypothetical protein
VQLGFAQIDVSNALHDQEQYEKDGMRRITQSGPYFETLSSSNKEQFRIAR